MVAVHGFARGADVLDFEEFVDFPFDGFQVLFVNLGDECDGVAFFPCSSGSADAVDVAFGVAGNVVVDDVGDVVNVQSSGRDVGGDEDAVPSAVEVFDDAVASCLAESGVDAAASVASLVEDVAESFGPVFGVDENHDFAVLCFFEDFEQLAEFLFSVNADDFLSDVFDGYFVGLQQQVFWVVHVFLRDVDNFFRHGCGEEKGLPLFGHDVQDFGHVVDEAHVEHAVCFVEYGESDVVDVDGVAFEVVEQASWRANGNLCGFELEDLRVDGYAAVDKDGFDGLVQFGDFFANLVR